ncbi:MAG TPA: T9SS type A sorting domain-containing protein [Flavobacteriales bacterium]
MQLLAPIAATWAQMSDDPSDATPSLTYTTTAGTTSPFAAACPGSGSSNPTVSHFSLSALTSTSTTIVGPATCGNFRDLPPAGPNPARDAWFRLDPPVAAHRFRFTLYAGGAPGITDGAMALYEAPSAAGPFRLVECAVGGSFTATQPSLEASCSTPGNKLYLRVWDQANRNSSSNFTICVQGQVDSGMASRGAAETACAAPTLTPSAATSTSIDYVFACEESSWLYTDSSYVGGDLWVKLTIPASGIVTMLVSRTSATTSFVNAIGMSAYLTSDCADPTRFQQISAFSGAPFTGAATSPPNWTITCLPAGQTLYVRIHSTRAAQALTKRYGRVNFRWTGPTTPSIAPTNSQPCAATPVALNTSCPVAPAAGGNIDACNTPGIPAPACGNFDGTARDVWYSFVAPPSGNVHIEASPGIGLPADPGIALYSTGGDGCTGRYTLIECDAKQGVGTGAAILRSGLAPGQTYYVRAWVASAAGGQGNFSLCVSELAAPPAGHCYYVVDMLALNQVGTQSMRVTIDSGTPVVYSTTGGDASAVVLVAVPIGSTVEFEYYNSGTNGRCDWWIYRLDDPDILWHYFSGVPIAGPGPLNPFRRTFTNACSSPVRDSDCLGTRTVCNTGPGTGTVFGSIDSSNTGVGQRFDLAGSNMGCLGTEYNGIQWLLIHPAANGTVAFWLDGTTAGVSRDLDFAIWDAGLAVYEPSSPNVSGSICAPNGPPVRCSSAKVNNSTGLQDGLVGVEMEGPGGWGWLSPLPVQADHIYLIAIVRNLDAAALPNVQYQLRWTVVNDAAGNPSSTLLDCTPLVLPVEFLSFEAFPQERSVDLAWATGSERNSSHFVVERSTDVQHFTPIGTVAAAGNSVARIDYTFTDPHPMKGANYYRLRQVDLDGSVDYSSTVVAVFDASASGPVVYPNPATEEIQVVADVPIDGPVMYLVMDATGRPLHSEIVSAQRGRAMHDLDLRALASGSYLLHMVAGDGTVIGNARFVKR